MAKQKPNFKPQGNKKSGAPKPSTPAPSKKQEPKTHHDSLKGNRGNR
jgi:hypothetical protein